MSKLIEEEEYKASCPKCKEVHTVYTQPNRCPEYYTDIEVLCKCGERIYFKLPVN